MDNGSNGLSDVSKQNDSKKLLKNYMAKDNKVQKNAEGGDIVNRQRPPSPAPYAFHNTDGERSAKNHVGSHVDGKNAPSNKIQASPSLRAPYAQPVLDASKMQASKRASTVDERIALVRERRLQQQQAHEDSFSARLAKEEAAHAKWEQAQEEKKKKIEEQKEKDLQRRKEVEERKNKQIIEEKKRAEAIVARTEQQTNVALRQKRTASADRTKRWSWGAGGQSKTAVGDDKFSKSPLIVDTTHMKFASGLRAYESTPPSHKKSPSSATSPPTRRARSLDNRAKKSSPAKDNEQTKKDTPEKHATTTRGRSPVARKSPSSNQKAPVLAPQLTDGVPASSRLFAPTRASLARSINRDTDELSTTSSTASIPLRSRSSDRKRPSSAKSDTSSASSTTSSSRNPTTSKLDTKKTIPTRGVSPSSSSRSKARPPSPSIPLAPPISKQFGESPKLRSPVSKESPKFPKRGSSPARSSTKSNQSTAKNTAQKDSPHTSKPPLIKQSLTPTTAVSRHKNSPNTSTSPNSNALSKKVQKKMQQPDSKKTTPSPTTSRRKNSKQTDEKSLNKTYTVATTQKKTKEADTAIKASATVKASQDRAKQEANDNENELNKTSYAEASNKIEKNEEEIIAEDVVVVTEQTTSLADEIHDVELEEENPGALNNALTSEPQPFEIPQPLPLAGASESPPALEHSLRDDAINKAVLDLSHDVIEAAQEQLQNEINPVNKHGVEASDGTLKIGTEQDQPVEEVEPKQGNVDIVGQQQNKTEVSSAEEPTCKTPIEESIDEPVEESVNTITEESAAVKQEVPAAANSAPVNEEPKKKEKKLTAEEQAYKDAIAAKRREMKEKREREEREKQERLKLEAEEQARREEDARRMAEEARKEQERLEEEEKIRKEEQEKKKKREAEELVRKHEEFLREQRERVKAREEQKAREEKIRKEKDMEAQKKEEERLARKKRIAMIMRRTRGGESPTTTPSGEQSPNLTPAEGNSPRNSLTPDRVSSPIDNEKKGEPGNTENEPSAMMNTAKTDHHISQLPTDNSIETITLDNSEPKEQFHLNGGDHSPPRLAFDEPLTPKDNIFSGSNFTPVGSNSVPYNTLNGSNVDAADSDQLAGSVPGDFNKLLSANSNDNEVPTGNLLDL